MNKNIIGVILLGGLIGSGNAQTFPSGSYLQSCGDLRWETSTALSAMCISISGSLRQSTLENASRCADVANIDGVLTCDGRQGLGASFNPNLYTDQSGSSGSGPLPTYGDPKQYRIVIKPE